MILIPVDVDNAYLLVRVVQQGDIIVKKVFVH